MPVLLALAAHLPIGFQQDPPPPSAFGEIVLSVARVEEVPTEPRFGSRYGWFGNDREPARFEVEAVPTDTGAEGLTLTATWAHDWFHHEFLRVRLAPDGTARAEVGLASDVPGARIDLAGVAVLVTDGRRGALELEAACWDGIWGAAPYFARFDLGGRGERFARAIEERLASIDAKAPWRDVEERFDSTGTWSGARTYVRTGRVDGLGRRQGFWSLRDLESGMRLDLDWRDGRAGGLLLAVDGEGRLRHLEFLEDGIAEGFAFTWIQGGGLFVSREVAGLAEGFLRYREDGSREPMLAEGMRRAWDEDGRLVLEEPAQRDSRSAPERVAAMRAELAAFHTRR